MRTVQELPINKLHAIWSFLKEFVDTKGKNIDRELCGLCYQLSILHADREFSSLLLILLEENMTLIDYPICDTDSDLGRVEQYNCLPHYEGRQLTLRLKLAEDVIKLINDSGVLNQKEKPFYPI
jgi:hypothetical protein